MCSTTLRLLCVAALICLAALEGSARAPQAADPYAEALEIGSGMRVRLHHGRQIELEVLGAGDRVFRTIAERVCGDAGRADLISAWNGGRPPADESWVRVPLELLDGNHRRLVLTNLFPEDRIEGDVWIHQAHVGALSTYDEGLWQVASWFTGDGSRYEQLMQFNGLSSPELRQGQFVRIPLAMLAEGMRPSLRSADGALEYEHDDDGPYAAYRLAPGEALYSAVVLRFTGRETAEDVRAVAEQIALRSGIVDPRDIPVGFRVKIPLDLLEPQFLPPGHPRRLAAEAARAEMERELARAPVESRKHGLEGVVIVLDPGHGGKDIGTSKHGVWEHDYVYDVACRFKQLMETHSAARVVLTVEDRKTGCTPSSTDKLQKNLQGTTMTTPPFLATQDGDARISANLRWYLASSIYRKETRGGTEGDRVLFLSLHADSRHPSLRGVMVYVPGAAYRDRTYGLRTPLYQKYAEVREQPRARFSKQARLRSEAVSRKLADSIVEAFRAHDLPVQPHQPVRNRIIRGRQTFVPAVLGGNAIPTKVLVEMVNIGNKQDAKLLAARRDRQRLAEALQDSVFSYFGEKPPSR